MIFCTQCGHKNADDARFCEECGKPTKLAQAAAAPAPVTAPPATAQATVPVPATAAPKAAFALPDAPSTGGASGNSTSSSKGNSKLIQIAAIAVVALTAIGAGAYFWLAPESASNERFAAAIERSLATQTEVFKPRYCLSNFPYNLSPVTVNENDQNTQRWLAVLSKAGLYSEPEVVEQNMGFFTVRKLSYTRTEAGNKAVQGNLLCIADGVSVVKVESFTPPEKLGELQASRASAKFKLRNPMPWVAAEETRAVAPEIPMEFAESVLLIRKDGKWQVPDARELQAADAAQRVQRGKELLAQRAAASGGDSIFSSLSKLLHFGPANPLQGRWSSQIMGVRGQSFEFDGDTMISQGQRIKVRYEIEDQRVTVYTELEGGGMVFNVKDHDNLTMQIGGMEIPLTRVQ
jgi:hypothetical protein